jgi:hypothetical protein
MSETSRKGVIILFGDPGGGKTTSALETFPGSLYYGTGTNGTQFFRTQRQRSSEYAKKYPEPVREFVVDMFSDNGKVNLDSEGMPIRLNHKATFENYLRALIKKAGPEYTNRQPLTYQNFIVDELGTLYQRVYEDILPTSISKSGKVDPLGAWNLLTKWAMEINGLYRYLNTLGINVVEVCHNTDPDAEKKGGPKLPSQGLQKLMTQEADMVLQRVVKDAPFELDMEGNTTNKPKPPLRLWTAFASEKWNAKNRGIPDEMLAEIATWELDRIVRYAGVDP